MRIGICSNSIIPSVIFQILSDLSKNNLADILIFKNNVSNQKSNSMLFKFLKQIEKIASGAKEALIPIEKLPFSESQNVDILICWGSNPVSLSPQIDVWTFWLNEERLDTPLSGLDLMFKKEMSITLSIRSRYLEGNQTIIGSCKMHRARTFSRTKEIATDYMALMLKKCIKNSQYLDRKQSNETIYNVSRTQPEKMLILLIIKNIWEKVLLKIKKEKTYWKLFMGSKGEIPLTNNGLVCINPPTDRFWADPFFLKFEEVQYIFVEEYIFNKRKAVIAVLRLESDGHIKRIATALEENYHLSYPNVFFIDNNLYMIPETNSIKTVQLYKCLTFPERWEKVKTIFEGIKASDTTIYFDGLIWWLFTSINQNGLSQNDQLFIYYTDDLLHGSLIPHPENPVVFGAERSRMAGNLFISEGRLYRPAQDCSEVYGGRVLVMEVIKLSPSEYNERFFTAIEPGSGFTGIHTYNEIAPYFIIDAY